jgi:hypothetical protein
MKSIRRIIQWAIILLILAACKSIMEQPTPVPTSTPTVTPSPSPTPTPTRPPLFDGQIAYELVTAQTDFGFRPAGSENNIRTGDWIVETLEQENWQVEIQPFEYKGTACRNIIGKMPDTGGRPVVILGAHYDTRLKADSDPDNPEEPVLGANDGASGTAVLLELAHALEPSKIPYQVWLAFFDAEDNGRIDDWDWIVGSSWMAEHLEITPEFVIIADMIGDADQQIYFEKNSNPALMATIWQTAANLGYADYFISEYRHSMLDDHTPFLRLGIPSVDLIDFDYPYWHTTEDTPDKVSAASLERVGRTLESFLESKEDTP